MTDKIKNAWLRFEYAVEDHPRVAAIAIVALAFAALMVA